MPYMLRQIPNEGRNMNTDKNAWSFWYSKKEETIDEEIPRLVHLFRIKNVSKILDLGCGTGRHTVYFAQEGFEVYGFDFSSYAVQRAKKRLKKKGLSAHLTVLDMRRDFPYKDEVFDAIVTIRVIHHARLRVIKKSIAEITRTLKKDGYFYADVPSRPRILQDENLKQKIVEPGTRIPLGGPEKGILHHDFTEGEVYRVLRDFEIQEIRKKDSHFHILARKKS